MSLEWRARSGSLAWSNPVAWWWGLLTLVSGVNIAAWFGRCTAPFRNHGLAVSAARPSSSCSRFVRRMFLAARSDHSFRARTFSGSRLFDTWLSSIMVGRTVATVSEVCFVVQWAIVLHQLGTITGADTTLNAAWVIVPLILIAECFSWHAVLTRNYLSHAVENSLWAVAFFIVGAGLCRLLPEFDGLVRLVLVTAIVGIAGYLAFLATIDVPMYLRRWRAEVASGSKLLSPLRVSAT